MKCYGEKSSDSSSPCLKLHGNGAVQPVARLAREPHCCGPLTLMVLIYNLIATEAEAQVRPVPVSVRIVSAGTIPVIWIIAPTGSVTIIACIRIAVAEAGIAEPGIAEPGIS